jgi:hypothetical protein
MWERGEGDEGVIGGGGGSRRGSDARTLETEWEGRERERQSELVTSRRVARAREKRVKTRCSAVLSLRDVGLF